MILKVLYYKSFLLNTVFLSTFVVSLFRLISILTLANNKAAFKDPSTYNQVYFLGLPLYFNGKAVVKTTAMKENTIKVHFYFAKESLIFLSVLILVINLRHRV